MCLTSDGCWPLPFHLGVWYCPSVDMPRLTLVMEETWMVVTTTYMRQPIGKSLTKKDVKLE